MTRSVSGKRLLAVMLSIMVAFTFMPVFTQSAYAAVKTPTKVKIKSATANANHVTVQWSKAKNAKKYKVFVQIGADGWKYWKSVKVTKKNKKKYSDKLKYKLKKSGKKYKVYKKKNPYRLVKTTTARKYTYTGKYSTTYRFVLQAVNGKKAGAYSAAKKAITKAKPTPTPQPTDPTTPATQEVPGKVTNLKATYFTESGKRKVKLTWTAASDATSYNVRRQKNGGSWSDPKNCSTCSYTLAGVTTGTVYKFEVTAKNDVGIGDPVSITTTVPADTTSTTPTPTAGTYSSNPSTAWNQYLGKMLEYYNQELDKKGLTLSSPNEFQKLQAIMQVMHDRIGYSEKGTDDVSNFPTGYTNWYYNDIIAAQNGTDRSGQYYNGKDYCSTIEFYGACDAIMNTECYLAEKAGLKAITVRTQVGTHYYTIIQANNIWYNADPGIYMYPACNGFNYGTGAFDPSSYFQEATTNVSINFSGEESAKSSKALSLARVFKASDALNNGTLYLRNKGCVISAENATYVSSDESVIEFDNTTGMCTLHKAGTAYITITYTNCNSSSSCPTYTTVIKFVAQ